MSGLQIQDAFAPYYDHRDPMPPRQGEPMRSGRDERPSAVREAMERWRRDRQPAVRPMPEGNDADAL